MTSALAIDFTAFVGAVVTAVVVLRANPTRSVNRAFAWFSTVAALWIASFSILTAHHNAEPLFWLRLTASIAAHLPLSLWILERCVLGAKLSVGLLERGWPWLVFAIILTIDCFSNYYIPAHSTPENPLIGPGYHLYSLAMIAGFLVLLFQTWRDLQKATGIHRLELTTILLGSVTSGLCGLALLVVGSWFDIAALRRGIPCVAILSYSITAWAITTQKIFDARYLFRSILRGAAYFGSVVGIIGITFYWLAHIVPPFVAVILGSLAILGTFEMIKRHFFKPGEFQNDSTVVQTRKAVLTISRGASRWEDLQKQFAETLAVWAHSENCEILVGTREGFFSEELQLPVGSPELDALSAFSFALPDGLRRRKPTKERAIILSLMDVHRLGAILLTSTTAFEGSLIIALRARIDRRPFTWPDIQLLQEWGTIIANAHARVSLSQQARDSEQLVTAGLLGASLAHEIRNPLVAIKLIVQSAAERYHDPDFRSLLIDLIPGEIERIESMVTGLMNLGRPSTGRVERLSLNAIVQGCLDLVQAKAAAALTKLDFSPRAESDELSGDPAGLKQVVLNLTMNAIEAVTPVQGERVVRVGTFNQAEGLTMEVSDNGLGIPEEIRSRLFRPFTTMNKTTGMGLGLAITAQIVRSHHGEIQVLEAPAGRETGTTFRITLPCQQPSS